MKGLGFNLQENNEEEFYTRLIELYCTIKRVKLSPTQKQVLIVFCQRGINSATKSYILTEGIAQSDQHYRNIQSYLYKNELLMKYGKGYRVIDSLSFKEKIGVLISLDSAVWHKETIDTESNEQE